MAEHDVFLGYDPRVGQRQAHLGFAGKRFGVTIAHRRFGKTVLARMELIDHALRKAKFEGAYIAPFLSQARRVFWSALRDVAMRIPHTECRETEMLVVFPNGSTIRCMGADSADGIRGLGFDLVVGDEFADWEPSVLPMVVIPTLAGRDGRLLLIGTAKGIDPLTEIYEKHLNDPEWYCAKFSGEETGVFTAEELAVLKSSMTDRQYRLEILCDWNVGAPDQLITGEMVDAAFARSYSADVFKNAPRIIGCDIARSGEDFNVIYRRQGLQGWEPVAFQDPNLMSTARKITDAYYAFDADVIFIDGGGVGAGVVDFLRERDLPIIEVQFGAKASDPRFLNLRAEMWFNMMHWIRSGGRIHPDPLMKTELTSPTHFTNDKGQTQVESKDSLKKRGLKSPDRADALAITFAFPVAQRASKVAHPAKSDWDPFG